MNDRKEPSSAATVLICAVCIAVVAACATIVITSEAINASRGKVMRPLPEKYEPKPQTRCDVYRCEQ